MWLKCSIGDKLKETISSVVRKRKTSFFDVVLTLSLPKIFWRQHVTFCNRDNEVSFTCPKFVTRRLQNHKNIVVWLSNKRRRPVRILDGLFHGGVVTTITDYFWIRISKPRYFTVPDHLTDMKLSIFRFSNTLVLNFNVLNKSLHWCKSNKRITVKNRIHIEDFWSNILSSLLSSSPQTNKQQFYLRVR